jgi:HK97 family phage portal protein
MLFRKFFKNETALTPTQSDLMAPQPWFMELFGGGKSASGQVVTPESSLRVATVYSCVNILANSVSKLPFQTFKETKNSRERDKGHKVAQLMEKRPNPHQTPFIFKHTLETHRNLWGNGYINIEWDMWGYPKNLWLLNPAVTEPYLDLNTNELWYHTVLPNGKTAWLHHTEVIHVKTLSLDGLKGKSMIQIARELVGSSQASQQFKGRFFLNGAANSGFLKIPAMLDPKAKDVIREEWEMKNSGIDNAGRVAILDAGLEFQSIGMPLKDAQFIEGMNYDKAEIATIFNVPLYKVNALDKATLNNVEQMAIEFLSDTLDPILTQYEEEFSYKLFSDIEQKKYYMKFALGKLMRTDSKTRAEFYGLMLDKGIFSINDALELEDRNSIEGGDTHRVDLNHVSIDIADKYQLTKASGGENLKGGEKDNEQGSKTPVQTPEE